MKKNFLKSVWLLFLLIGWSCGPTTVKRPFECWVLRSVLDMRPRMISMALTDNVWLSYNTQTGSVYKFWKGKINFEGAVFTASHGPQPTAEGVVLQQEPDENPWRIVLSNNEEVTPDVLYKGHIIMDNRITLQYDLRYKDFRISINENPDVSSFDSLGGVFNRTFVTENVPAGVKVALKMNLPTMKTEKDYDTNGDFLIEKSKEEKIESNSIYKVSGRLTLKSNDRTSFNTHVSIIPSLPTQQKEIAQEEVVLNLMAKSDCNTCHNRSVKTIGPSYMDIARRYPNEPRRLVTLIEKVILGGSGNWGEVPMTPHTDLSREHLTRMVSYILSLDKDQEAKENALLLVPEFPVSIEPYDFNKTVSSQSIHGVVINQYRFQESLKTFPEVGENLEAFRSMTSNAVFFGENRSYPTNMLKRIEGTINMPKDENLILRLVSEGPSRLYLDNKLFIEISGNTTLVNDDAEVYLKKGPHAFKIDCLFDVGQRLSLQWKVHGSDSFRIIPPDIYSYSKQDVKQKQVEASQSVLRIPGDGIQLDTVHPAFDLAQARPVNFHPKVGGMDFLSDGRMVVSTWDSLGSVYILDGVEGKDPEAIKVKLIAQGLAEPLGLKVVDDEIYVLQKQELTKLIDLNGDEVIDQYQSVCNSWGVSANFHEFAFGLVYQQGYFYGTLATAINPGGASTKPQVKDRGKVIRISKLDGSFELVASGLRTPNGIGIGIDDQIFIADNQGDWLPANKIVHYQPGAWYGSRSVDFMATESLTEALPVVWLPQDEIGNSPSQPTILNAGSYKNQMIHGDITHGGIKRIFVEKIDGQYQGAVFRFTQGLEVGINRLAWGPDGALYAGGLGARGNWSQAGKLKYGLQKLTYNGKNVFEMLAVRATSKGIEIEFTSPLKSEVGLKPSDYIIKQWWYKPTADYGGPKLDEEDLTIKKISVSNDRKKVSLEIPGIKRNHVVYIRLNYGTIISSDGEKLWTTESWYTMNNVPK